MQSAVLAIVNPSVRLSVYLSVTRWHSFRMPVTFCIFCIQSPHVCGAVHYSLFARGSTFVFVFSSPHLHICLRHLVSAENFTDTVHQAHYKWNSQEHHGLLASLWKGQVVPIDVSRAPGSISSGGGPPPCHRRRDATTTWLAETSWSSKIHLAESDRWGRSAPELWGPHGLEEGKRKGCLASNRQYGNALLGVCH